MSTANGLFVEEAAAMKFQGAVMRGQGVTFAIIMVKEQVIDNSFEIDTTRRSFQTVFPGLPIVLMAQNFAGRNVYDGRDDIIGFLSGVPFNAIPWRQYTVS